MDIAPEKHSLDKVFSHTTYHLDFYQRDYKWNEEPVQRLLEDIFFRFNSEYETNKELTPDTEVITRKYPWYYLNTYVTNEADGKIYIVDGQQRLTTITLILIKLYHLADSMKSGLTKWTETKIAGVSGYKNEFWMNHPKHRQVLDGLFSGKPINQIDTSTGTTAQNLVNNYKVISDWIDEEVDGLHKLETFIFYFLHRLVIINLHVDQTNVPMIFEVINDRGVRLSPHEILKGKLLGQIDKTELESNNYTELWDGKVEAINQYGADTIDSFFSYLLKAKFANNRGYGNKFDGNYHRTIFDDDVNYYLALKNDANSVKSFLNKEFSYYTDLFVKSMRFSEGRNKPFEYLFFNNLNDIDGQFLLVLSHCRLHDTQEEEKIKRVAFELDRFFSLLQLQNAYESNLFNDKLYQISKEIRDGSIESIRETFDKYLLEVLSRSYDTDVNQPFQYAYFRNAGINLPKRFLRYFFARVDEFLADHMNEQEPYDFYELVMKTGPKNGFHIEHIMTNNEVNLEAYDNDQEVFEQERNRLGALLLLKGRDNISSGDETFNHKLKTYENTLLWNRTLTEGFYKSNKDIEDLKNKYKLDLQPVSKFGPEELEKRQRLLFEIAKIIWS